MDQQCLPPGMYVYNPIYIELFDWWELEVGGCCNLIGRARVNGGCDILEKEIITVEGGNSKGYQRKTRQDNSV